MPVRGCIDACVCVYMCVYACMWLHMTVEGCTAVGVQISCSFSDGAALETRAIPGAAPLELWFMCIYARVCVYMCVYAYVCV